MERCFLWLVSVADCSLRIRLPGSQVRQARSLEPSDWFCSMLQKHGGPDFEKSVLRAFAGKSAAGSSTDDAHGGYTVETLVELSARDCVYDDGIATAWDCQAVLQRAYYGDPKDGYELRVEEVCPCKTPPAIHHKVVRRCGSGGICWPEVLLRQRIFRSLCCLGR